MGTQAGGDRIPDALQSPLRCVRPAHKLPPLLQMSNEYPCRLAAVGSAVLIDVFEQESAEEVLTPARVLMDETIRQLGSVHVAVRIRAGSSPPPPAERKANAAWLGQQQGRAKVAICLEGAGFWSAAFRGVISGMVALSGQRGVVSVLADIDECVTQTCSKPSERAAARAFFAEGDALLP